MEKKLFAHSIRRRLENVMDSVCFQMLILGKNLYDKLQGTYSKHAVKKQ